MTLNILPWTEEGIALNEKKLKLEEKKEGDEGEEEEIQVEAFDEEPYIYEL